jgi:hypothetical protein
MEYPAAKSRLLHWIHHLFPSLKNKRIQLDLDVMFIALANFAGTSRIEDLVNTTRQVACKFSYAGSATYF